MRKIASAVLSVFFTLTANTQETSANTSATETEKGKTKDKQKAPDYPGGLKEFYKFMSPKTQRTISYRPGTMIVTFMVNEDGRISDIETVEGINTRFDEKVREIIAQSPQWIPAEQDGVKVSALYRLPLHFN